MQISVIGGRDVSPELLAAAEAVGAEIARRGHTLVSGGLTGVMEAASRGARSAGGHTVAILPGDDPHEANPHVEFVIPSGLGVARNTLVVRSGDAVIAVGGSYGTLSEIAFALQFGKPLIGIGTWPLEEPDGADPIARAATAEEAVTLAEQMAAGT